MTHAINPSPDNWLKELKPGDIVQFPAYPPETPILHKRLRRDRDRSIRF